MEMKKTWKKPVGLTLTAAQLAKHIQAAARSGCDFFVLR